MNRYNIISLILLFFFISKLPCIKEYFTNYKSIKVAILIISIKDNNSGRWYIERGYWKKYMNSHKNIDCFFIECDNLEHFNTLSVKCKESYIPGIFQKTIRALIQIGDGYDYYIRTNLSSFFIFKNLIKRLKKIPINKPTLTGGFCGSGFWVSGTSIILNKKSRDILVREGIKDEYYNNKSTPDDYLIGLLFSKNKVKCNSKDGKNILYWWKYKNSYENNIKEVDSKKYTILRMRNDSNVAQYQNIVNKLIKKYYPNLK